MTELLPIVFVRGQNESIDPRLAPPDVHAVARNVRWRKDGRPAKKYGVTPVTTTGLAASAAYNAQPVNALATWDDTPVIAIGGTVRQLGASGWNSQTVPGAGDISHFGPGKHSIIARDESAPQLGACTSGQAQGLVLTAWDTSSQLYYTVKDLDGSVVLTPRLVPANFVEPRCVSTNNFIYIIAKTGTQIAIWIFNPVTLTLTTGGVVGNLDAAGSHFDACGRGTDFLVSYQSAPNAVTTKIFTATAFPALVQTNATAALNSLARIGVVGNATSNIFVAVQDLPTGELRYQIFNNILTASVGGVIVETVAGNTAQPGMVLESDTIAWLVWGGFILASETGYTRVVRIGSAGLLGPINTNFGIAPMSKPFMGPAFAALGEIDGGYLWVSTANADNGSTKWDSQRAYLLVKLSSNNVLGPIRHMHLPGVPSATQVGSFHISDVLNLGPVHGFYTPLLNAIRFGNNQTPAWGVDAVTALSIFSSPRAAARDTSIAGRVLQFSGGSLYELNGVAEETGFSNFPVIQSIVGGGGGALTPNATYLYRAVYEWLDDQGRRHRSATSNPFSFATGANTSATLTVKPLVAQSHSEKSGGFTTPLGAVLHIYRSLAGLSTLHRVTPNVGAPVGYAHASATVSFLDTMIDGIAGGQEFLYTEGGVADNTLCPPHTFQTVCNGRVWVGGQLDRCVATASKLLVDGEPTQFSDLDVFNTFLPQENTGIASLDGTVVLFAADRIYLVGGDGPNDQGVGEFSPPSELPTDVGCIEWRSVLETSIGIFFQARRGIYLLPRGFGTPVFIGAEVESTLAQYPIVTSASLVVIPSNDGNSLGEITARFVVAADETSNSTAVLVYDLRTGGWSVDDLFDGPKLGGVWPGAFATARATFTGILTLQSESAAGIGYARHNGGYIITTLATGDIRPFSGSAAAHTNGIASYGNFCKVVLVGEFRGACDVFVSVSVDGAVPDTFVFPVTSPDGPADNSVYLDVTPRIALGSAIRVSCSDGNNPSAPPTEGFIMQALIIEYETIGKTKRLAAARRA